MYIPKKQKGAPFSVLLQRIIPENCMEGEKYYQTGKSTLLHPQYTGGQRQGFNMTKATKKTRLQLLLLLYININPHAQAAAQSSADRQRRDPKTPRK
jgi:hypothetical protein